MRIFEEDGLSPIPLKEETDCPSCGTRFSLPNPVDAGLHVWCDVCWHGMTTEEKLAAVNKILPIERATVSARRTSGFRQL